MGVLGAIISTGGHIAYTGHILFITVDRSNLQLVLNAAHSRAVPQLLAVCAGH